MKIHAVFKARILNKVNNLKVISILTIIFLLFANISFAQVNVNASRIVKMQSSAAIDNSSMPPVISMEHATKDINKFGSINIVQNNKTFFDTVIINDKPITLPQSSGFGVYNLMYKINLTNNNIVYILYAGTGGTIDNDTNLNCYFVEFKAHKQYQISGLNYCPTGFGAKLNSGVMVKGDAIYIKFFNNVSYRDADDFGIVRYQDGKTKIIKNIKSSEYYKKKFASFTTKQIVEQAKKDGCYLKDANLIDSSHYCGYGQKYCFEFHASTQKNHDEYFEILEKSCSQQ